MMMMRWLVVALAAAAVVVAADPAPAAHGVGIFYEGVEGRYLRPSEQGAEEEAMSADTVAASAAVLLGVQPTSRVTAATSRGVDALVRPQAFDRPGAVLTIQLAGAPSGAMAAAFGDSAAFARRAALVSRSDAVAGGLDELLAAPALERAALECTDGAEPAAVAAEAAALGASANLARQLGCLDQGAAAFADKDAAGLWITAELNVRAARDNTELLALVARTVESAVQRVGGARGGRLVSQVLLLNDVPSAASRRVLLDDPLAAPPVLGKVRPRPTNNEWVNQFLAVSVFVILLIAATVGVCCMCQMDLNQDSLLYQTRTKTD